MALTLDGTNGLTFNDTSLQGAAASPYVLKNRIINGDMVIDQRNAGASVTVNTSNNFYDVDRFFGTGQVTDGVFTLQQSSTAPVGFVNSMVATVTTADSSLGATQQYVIGQSIEGFNTADLQWGTANAKTITLSFWVRSSLTGTFGGALINSAFNRSYPFSYTISVANTWEQKSVTIAGDTSGTWIGATNGIGIRVLFSLGAGSTYSGTAGAWSGSYLTSATGAVSVIGTNAATWYVTGVQLEVGSTATPFERRLYDKELISCQRYYELVDGLVSTSAWTGILNLVYWKVTKRAAPTITTTVPSGSGAVFATFGYQTNSAYQSVANSAFTSAYVIGNSEL